MSSTYINNIFELFGFFDNSFSSNFKEGKSFSLTLIAIAICIAVGKTSLLIEIYLHDRLDELVF